MTYEPSAALTALATCCPPAPLAMTLTPETGPLVSRTTPSMLAAVAAIRASTALRSSPGASVSTLALPSSTAPSNHCSTTCFAAGSKPTLYSPGARPLSV